MFCSAVNSAVLWSFLMLSFPLSFMSLRWLILLFPLLCFASSSAAFSHQVSRGMDNQTTLPQKQCCPEHLCVHNGKASEYVDLPLVTLADGPRG